jgi:hypothetical protein
MRVQISVFVAQNINLVRKASLPLIKLADSYRIANPDPGYHPENASSVAGHYVDFLVDLA